MTPTLGPELPAPYHGIHIAVVQRNHEKIKWFVPTCRADRIKVRDQTCDCKATVYELCQAGALMFVRRTIRELANPRIHETEWLITVRAEKIWHKILTGQAR